MMGIGRVAKQTSVNMFTAGICLEKIYFLMSLALTSICERDRNEDFTTVAGTFTGPIGLHGSAMQKE